MRAVQAYLNVKSNDASFESEVDLLVGKLSVIRNKKLGFTTVLYTTEKDARYIKENRLDILYDEIHYLPKYYFAGIKLLNFWAFAKFAAIKEELKRSEPFFIVDTDLVFMNEDILEALKQDTLFWLDAEPFSKYPKLTELPRPIGFKFPRGIDVKARPINTAILYINNKEALKEYIDLAGRFARDNDKANDSRAEMITVEQRFIASILKKYDLPRNCFCEVCNDLGNKKRNYGPSHFHTWGMKSGLHSVNRYRRSGIKTLLLIIREQDIDIYNDIIEYHKEDVQEVLDKGEEIPLSISLDHYLKNKEDNALGVK